MTAQIIEQILPSPYEIAQEYPLTQEHQKLIAGWRQVTCDILSGQDPRLLLIVGPCSIHDREGALEYGQRLYDLSKKVASKAFIIMRTYIEKPRTMMGWKGFLHDPHLDGSYDFLDGIRMARSLLIDLTELALPCASELLEITTTHYYADFLTWGCIGARTSSSQPHRQLASSMPFPIGFKNSMEGSLDSPLCGMIAAGQPQTFMGMNRMGRIARIESEGNHHCHLVLRGSIYGSNYDQKTVKTASQLCARSGRSPHLIIDCSHDNSKKRAERQIEIFKEIVAAKSERVKGIMLESYLKEGNQEISPFLKRGISITDPCLSWSDTEELVLGLFNN